MSTVEMMIKRFIIGEARILLKITHRSDTHFLISQTSVRKIPPVRKWAKERNQKKNSTQNYSGISREFDLKNLVLKRAGKLENRISPLSDDLFGRTKERSWHMNQRKSHRISSHLSNNLQASNHTRSQQKQTHALVGGKN